MENTNNNNEHEKDSYDFENCDKKSCKDFFKDKYNKKCNKVSGGSGCTGCIYFLIFIGSAVYFIQQADGFWPGVLGVLKALVWPAMIIYKVLGLLGM